MALRLIIAVAILLIPAAFAQDLVSVPPDAQASPSFNVDAATEAYLALIPPKAKVRSDAYFEGGYWLLLWDFLYACAISVLLLQTRWSAAMRNFAEKLTRFKP